MKGTPKSCSCRACKRGKHTATGHYFMRLEERAERRRVKELLNVFTNTPDADAPLILPAYRGAYND